MNAKKATMNVSRSRTLGMIVGGAALLLSVPAYALSLGAFQVESALDEPLQARIALTSVDPATLDSLEITLGTKEDFQRADVPRSEFLRQLKFTVSKDAKEPVVIVSSDKPIREPFLHFLVSAQWSGGKLVREYTGLLDPPLYASGSPSTVESPAMSSGSTSAAASTGGSTTAVEPASGGGTTASSSASTSAGSSMSTGSSGRSAEYGPTRPGDTLWDIASKLDTGSMNVNVFQVMIALLRQNPDAFIDNNINRLKTGQTLRLADLSAVADVSPEEASATYTAQLDAWETYKSTVASAGAEVEVPSQEAGEGAAAQTTTAMAGETASASGTGTSESSAASDQAAASASGSGGQGQDNVLKIVQATLDDSKQSSESAGAGSDRSGEIAELRGQIATLQESLESRNLENKELRERVQLLETQVENAQRLVNIQDQELAAAQQQAAERQAAAEAAASAQQVTTQPVEPAANESMSAQQEQAPANEGSMQEQSQSEPEPVAVASASGQDEQAAQPEPAKAEAAAATQNTKPKAEASSNESAAKVRKVSSRPPVTSTSWWAGITDMLFSSWMWMVGAGVGVLVLVLGLLMFLRRRQSIAEFEESILSGSALDSYSETTDTAGSSASDTSFLSDFGTAGMGTMQADEVDPLAEAEVYLAYGRDEQAEDVLKEAARRDPDRSEIKLKLLEIYKQRNDVKSFETIAEELYPAGDQGDAEVWQKVTAMGREVNPGNPLFQGAGGGGPAPAPAAAAPAATGPEEPGEMNFDLDEPAAPTPARGTARPTEQRQPVHEDLGLDLDEAPEPAAPAAATVAAESGDNTLDFGDEFMAQTSRNVDPSMQPFPAPDQQTDLDRELDRLASEREATAASKAPAGDQGPGTEASWDRADSDTSTLNFPASDNSEIEFDLNLDDSSIQQLTGEDKGGNSQGQNAGRDTDQDVGREGGAGEGLMEFESENIPPEETWAGPSTDATPGGDDDSVAYSPADDVQSAAAPQYNEAETKLDLARAYLDMGDKVGARSIIDEVMREGDPAQRDQAAELAAQL